MSVERILLLARARSHLAHAFSLFKSMELSAVEVNKELSMYLSITPASTSAATPETSSSAPETAAAAGVAAAGVAAAGVAAAGVAAANPQPMPPKPVRLRTEKQLKAESDYKIWFNQQLAAWVSGGSIGEKPAYVKWKKYYKNRSSPHSSPSISDSELPSPKPHLEGRNLYMVTIDGNPYVHDDKGNCWLVQGGRVGKWVGIFNPDTDELDSSAAKPIM